MGRERASVSSERPKPNGKAARYRRWRTVHLATGFLVCLWLLLMAVSGVLINHQEALGLLEIEVDNHYLPAHYTDEYHPGSTRLNVVVADLHSGRFFGDAGRIVSDVIAALVAFSIFSAVYTFRLRQKLSGRPMPLGELSASSDAGGSRPTAAHHDHDLPIQQAR